MENTQFSQMFQDPIQSTIKEARQIADMIKSQRLQARTQPAVSALSDITRQWQSAQDDEQRQRLNALASLTRANYLAGGGSPADLPKQYWGSDPTQGFQTTAGFEAPITGLEGLKRQDAISNKLKFLQDAFEKQKWEASPESDPRYKGLYLTKLQRDAYAPYSTGGGGPTTRENYSSAIADAQRDLGILKSGYGSQSYADKYSTEYGMLAPAQVVEQNINANRARLTADGINPDSLIDDVYRMAYGVDRNTYWSLESDYSGLR